MLIAANAIILCSHLPRLLPRQTALLVLASLTFAIAGSGGSIPPKRDTARFTQQSKENESNPQNEPAQQNPDASAHPYLQEPLKHLVKRIPELKGIRPAADQQKLQAILKKTGELVDEFFDNAVDLVADEEIKQERLGSFGSSARITPLHDSYLILRHANGAQADFEEFRTDEKGNRLDQVGLERGFLATSGFALICSHFSSAFQPDSTFRYLGDEKVNGRETYALVFAQQSGKASLAEIMIGPRGTAEHMLAQGIAWVDQQNYHILRMRTDLLAPHPEVELEEQTTKVNFAEVHLADIATPLWLPSEVIVYLKIQEMGNPRLERAFRNVHHYSNYRRYRVAVKMVPPQ